MYGLHRHRISFVSDIERTELAWRLKKPLIFKFQNGIGFSTVTNETVEFFASEIKLDLNHIGNP